LVEGIGYDFIPQVLDNRLIDQYIKIEDKDAFEIARRLIAEEGLLVGGSCGAAMWGALQAAKRLDAGQNCLVILPDSIRNYLSKYANDDWMRTHDFL
jgi:cysteine synthase